jgi:cell division protein FtsQ
MRPVDYKSTTAQKRTPARQPKRASSRRERSSPQARPGLRRALLELIKSGQLLSLCLFLVTMWALYHLFTSPQFNIQAVDVHGNNALRTEIIVEMSGLQGVPIWFVNADAVAERLLQNAYVEQVSVHVTLPDHAGIGIAERKPEVRWQLNGMHYLVDSSGVVLDVAQAPPEPGTLVIMDTTVHNLEPGNWVDADAIQLAQVLALRLPSELNFMPASIGWDIGLGVFVTSDSGQKIIFGQSDNLDRKLAVLNFLLNDGTAFTYLDLRPSNPFYQNSSADSQ